MGSLPMDCKSDTLTNLIVETGQMKHSMDLNDNSAAMEHLAPGYGRMRARRSSPLNIYSQNYMEENGPRAKVDVQSFACHTCCGSLCSAAPL